MKTHCLMIPTLKLVFVSLSFELYQYWLNTFFFFLATLHGLWDLSSSTRD